MIDIVITVFKDEIVLDIDIYNDILYSTYRKLYSNSSDGWMKLLSCFDEVRKRYPNANLSIKKG